MMTWMILTLSLFAAVGVWIFWIEPNWFHLKHTTLRVKKSIGKPLTILHLTDFHFTRERFFISLFFDRLSRLDIDFVFLTGDFIDATSGIKPCIANLKKLKPKKGFYAVLGNHDYRSYPPLHQWIAMFKARGEHPHYFAERPEAEIQQLKQALTEMGVRLLFNQNVTLPLSDNQRITLIGVDDPVTGRANLERAFDGARDGCLQLAMVHSPILFPSLCQFAIDAAFAGHTHGGQIRLPGLGAFPLVYRFVSNIIDSTDRFGFYGIVCRGMGAQELAHPRLFCRPEAILARIEGI